MLVELSTKANTLVALSQRLKSAVILPVAVVTREQWTLDSKHVLAKLYQQSWMTQSVVVRSSALTEDTNEYSNAGKYDSILDIRNQNDLIQSINKVFASYDQPAIDDQVLIQPFISNVKLSGVALTKEPSTAADYTIINYDATSGLTDSITAGRDDNEVLICYNDIMPDNQHWSFRVMQLCNELKVLLNQPALDIEFAIDQQDQLILFQVRKLHLTCKSNTAIDVKPVLEQITDLINDNMQLHPYLAGDKTIYGVMPDWNPAEIIGLRPRQLALSLYKELITDQTWAYQRDNYGYCNLRSFPLLIDFAGLPYIDTRVSFNSFIPKTLSENLANKLVNYYLYRLEQNPALHDKVEFEIVFSCYTFSLQSKLDMLDDYGFEQSEKAEIFKSLVHLTNNIIHNEHGLWRKDLQKVEILKERQQTILNSNLGLSAKIYWLIEDCKRYGTLPFAGLARASFIGVQILKSMVAENIITDQDYQNFMLSVDSVSSRMARDLAQLSKAAFLQTYGHLRPGTYDILSPRYDADPDRYFNWKDKPEHCVEEKPTEFALTLPQLKKIQARIRQDGLEIEVLELLDFIKEAVELREYSKFVFTKSVSDVLELVAEYGHQLGVTREDCAYLNICDLLRLYGASEDEEKIIKQSIAHGKTKEVIAKQITLPPVILSAQDVWWHKTPDIMPNFITQKFVEAPVIADMSDKSHLAGNIIFIPSADPGYDWLFSHNIAGFVTKFGGANSHMAIRANELGIPAIIGAGELFYNKWSKAQVLHLDCLHKQVLVIR